MAKKKEAEEIKTDGWKDTFSDLMNLLLCFFVLLYSMSTVDEIKFAELVASLNNSFSIFPAGAQAIGEGTLVSSGATQLNNLDEYYSDMGKQSQETDSQDPLAELEEKQRQEQIEKLEELYGEVVEESENKHIEDDLTVKIDDGYQYVMLSLSGSVLFDSGSADIQAGAKPLLNHVADILKKYPGNRIEIEGHTDNAPISTAEFPSNLWLSTARATKVLEYFDHKKGLSMENMTASGRGEVEPVANNKTAAGRAKNRRVEIKIYGLSQ